jgi:hypothetical protein
MRVVSCAGASHSFTKSEASFGFLNSLSLASLTGKEHGFLWEDDSLHFRVSIEVDMQQSSCYHLRKETSCAGLLNRGEA